MTVFFLLFAIVAKYAVITADDASSLTIEDSKSDENVDNDAKNNDEL